MVEVMEHWLACAQGAIGGGDQRSASRALLRRLLAAEGFDPAWPIETDDGKPRLSALPGRPEPPAISIAHSTGRAAVALSRVGPVGIDIEAHNSTRNWMGIAELYFGPREAAGVAGADGLRAFYRIWTLREAMGKATGEGLLTDQRDRVDPGTPDEGAWVSADRRWLLAHVEPAAGFSLALAVLPRDGIDLGRWSLDAIGWPVR
jgi:4'-phosphopantetheinyl transferase